MTHRFQFNSATLCLSLASIILLSPSATTTAAAGPGPCEADDPYASGAYAYADSFLATVHTGCTAGVPSGAAIGCIAVTNGAGLLNFFAARWPSAAARTMDTTGGCIFMCTSGDCRVGNDGLPVELLQFGVE